MKIAILRGHGPEDVLGSAIHGEVMEALGRRGWEADDLDLTKMKVGPCVGCFNCWLKTPGLCSQNDGGRETAKSRACKDALVILSRVTFGGYSSKVKYAMDRNVPNILPFFIKHKGEMHHPQRYGRQGLLTLGWQDRSEEMTAGFFAKLAERNSRNMQATVQDSRVLHGGQTAEERREAVETLLRKLEARS